jgi:leucyl aminopeptidase (aminopeptidase T)
MGRFIQWEKRPENIKREAERMEREKAVHVVRVVYDPFMDEAEIYRRGRQNLKQQELSPEEKQIMLAAGEDERVYFYARWSVEETKWLLIERAPSAVGW